MSVVLPSGYFSVDSAFLVACALWFVGILALAYLVNIANHIYRCALFIFASAGKIPAPFDQVAMQSAWKMKR